MATTTTSVDTWALQNLSIMQDDSTTGRVCLIGYLHSLLIVWLVRTTNQSLKIGTIYHWKNGKKRLFCSEQSILITKDLFTHQVTGISFVSWLLMRFLDSWCYTPLETLVLKLIFLLLRSGCLLLEVLTLSCPTGHCLHLNWLHQFDWRIGTHIMNPNSILALD